MASHLSNKGKVAIVGCGLIGQAWAMIFASAGYKVSLYDVLSEQIENAKNTIQHTLQDYHQKGCLKGPLSPEEQFGLISGTPVLRECLEDAIFIQESVPEILQIKHQVYRAIDIFMSSNTILSSSTSSFLPSVLSEHSTHRSQFIVAHPVNPPYFIPLVEIVPAAWTSERVITRTREIMTEIGMKPVTLTTEIRGFALNRIQFAVLNECYHLVHDGVLSAKDIDRVMSEGLGLRYAFLGPLETIHLNSAGIEDYCKRFGNSIFEVSQTFKPTPLLDGTGLKEVAKQVNQMCPISQIPDRAKWRDDCLYKLSKLKGEQAKEKR
ncbi:hypothetical protein M8J77_006240 [Diaphorina citri]|nr:hypothetical protein M8J77_006240 [Diaphorina citri]